MRKAFNINTETRISRKGKSRGKRHDVGSKWNLKKKKSLLILQGEEEKISSHEKYQKSIIKGIFREQNLWKLENNCYKVWKMREQR